jgi:malonyl-ACP decarboxylase
MSRVFVSGMGIHGASGYGCARFARALRAGESLVRPCAEPQLTFRLYKAPLAAFDFKACLGELMKREPELSEAKLETAWRAARRSSATVQLSVLVALEAWHQAELGKCRAVPERVGIVVAGHNTTQRYQREIAGVFESDLSFVSPEYAFQSLDTDHVGTLSEVLGAHGEGHTIGAASASGNLGLLQGYRMIHHGYLDVCVVVGCMAELSAFELQALHNAGALAPQRGADTDAVVSRPFDRAHQGFVPGEASGCMILESAASVAARGVAPLAQMCSAVATLSGSRLPAPDARAEAAVMRRALAEAHQTAANVDYVNAHGTGSPAGDCAEGEALRAVFGQLPASPYINTSKAIVGHCLWSAGVIEAIATVIQINGSFVHATPGLCSPIHDGLRWARERCIETPIRLALSNSFGFGGIQSCLALSRAFDATERGEAARVRRRH